ncbi:MAG: class I SAM-dependent methyltransferase [Thermoplasmata archaeon]
MSDAHRGEGDRHEAARFAREMIRRYGDALVTVLVDLGDRLGLFAALASGPGTSAEIAERAVLAERPVREWLSALAASGIVEYSAVSNEFSLPPERAVCLTGASPLNVAPASRLVSFGTKNLGTLEESFRNGHGIGGERFLPDSTLVFGELSRRRYDAAFVSRYIPLVPGLREQLVDGAHVIDLGCGAGHAINLLAGAFPRSTFRGIDTSAPAIELARQEADRGKLGNVSFDVGDATRADGAYDLALALDAVHDQVRPEEFLRAAYRCLRPGGILLAVEPKASSQLEENIGRLEAPYLYGLSVLYCLPVSLAESGAGLGTCWGEQAIREMLAQTGFAPIELREAPLNSMGSVWIAHRPESEPVRGPP